MVGITTLTGLVGNLTGPDQAVLSRPFDCNCFMLATIMEESESLEQPQSLAKAGAKGGRARMAALTPDERKKIARAGAAARWSKNAPVAPLYRAAGRGTSRGPADHGPRDSVLHLGRWLARHRAHVGYGGFDGDQRGRRFEKYLGVNALKPFY